MASQTPKSPAPAKPAKERPEPTRLQKNKALYIGTIILLAFSIVAFIFWGSSGSGGGSSGQVLEFGSYAGTPINTAQGGYLTKQVSIVNDAMKQQGLSEQNYQLYAYQVWRQAFERTAVHLGIMHELKTAGAIVTENHIDELMASDPAFQENGTYSPRLFREASQAKKSSLRASHREDSLTELYTNDIYALAPSQTEIAFVKNMAKETRTIEYAVLPLSAYPDSEVAAWAAANAGLFRHLKLARISVSKSQAEAERILKQVKAGTVKWEDAAKANSTDGFADKGGSMGPKYFYEIQSDLAKKEDAEKVASLKAGEYSEVLTTLSGAWVIFKAEEAATAADPADPLVLKDARAYILRVERGRIEDWATAQATALSKTPSADFDKAAKKAGLEVKTSGPFPLNYGDVDFSAYGQRIPLFQKINSASAPELAKASTNEAFLQAIFSLAPGAVSAPLVLGDNVLVVKVKEAGAATDEDLASLSLYYPYFYQQKASYEVQDVFLKSPLLKDNFMNIFFKYLMPKQ
jgi:hypothetical protein